MPPVEPIPPSVLLVVLDDVGIDQLSCYDAENSYSAPYAYAYTPNLDALVAGGARFTQCRSAANCSPSRAMLLTGRYGFRTGCGALVTPGNESPSFSELGSPTPETGFPALLSGRRKAIGKWHLGLDAANGGSMPGHPTSLGFTSWSGVLRNLSGGGGELPPGQPGYTNFLWWHQGVSTQIQGTHATGYTADAAIAWIASVPLAIPWMLYLCFNAAHQPWTAADVPPTIEHGFGTSIDSAHLNTNFRAHLEAFDYHLGRVLAALTGETVVILIGDNSTPGNVDPVAGEPRYPIGHPLHQTGDDTTQLSMAPYDHARAKGSVYEHGIRVPLIVSGPGVTAGVRTELASPVDVFRTVCEINGALIPGGAATDSISLVPVLSGQPGSRVDGLSERFNPNGVGETLTLELRGYVRQDGANLWKLVRRSGFADELYDVAADPLELSDLGTGHAEYQATVDAMIALLAS